MSRTSPPNTEFEVDRRTLLTGLAASLFAAGCGVDTYQSRLEQTRLFFDYMEKVNQALGARTTPFDGVEVRVPKPFVPIIPPPENKSKDAPAEPPPLDPKDDPSRLGYHPNVKLEGVLASWRATVALDGQGASEGLAYLHLVSNLPRHVDKQSNNDIEPHNYRRDLINVLSAAYNVQTESTDAPWPWEIMQKFSEYVGKKKVDSIAIPPEDQPINAILYWINQRDVEVGLLLIFPRATDPRLRLEEKMKHTLETLKFPTQPPQKKAGKQTQGGF